jgi:small Trp-rich protein
MYLVLVGTLLVILKFADVDPVVGWTWWWVLSPFAGAFAWWVYSDSIGLTKKREMDKMEDRKEQRRRKAFAALGLDFRKAGKDKKKAEAWRRSRQAQVDKVEGKRAAERKRHADTIARSRFDSELDSTQQGSEFETAAPSAKK